MIVSARYLNCCYLYNAQCGVLGMHTRGRCPLPQEPAAVHLDPFRSEEQVWESFADDRRTPEARAQRPSASFTLFASSMICFVKVVRQFKNDHARYIRVDVAYNGRSKFALHTVRDSYGSIYL